MFRKIATYSASIYAVSLGASALSFGVTMLIARRIPKEALGLFGFYLAMYAFLGMLISSGLNQALLRFFGRGEDRYELTRILLGVAILTALVAWPAALAGHLLGWTAAAWALTTLPFMVTTVLGASEFRATFARGKEIALTLSVSMLNSTLTVAFAFLLARPPEGGPGIDPGFAPILGDFLSLAIPGTVLFLVLARTRGLRNPLSLFSRARGDTATRLFRFALPLAVAGMAFVAWTHASSMLIRGIVGLAALAEFYFAIQLLQILDKPLQILARVTLAGFAHEPDIAPEAHRRLVTFNVALFPLLGAGIAYAAPLILAMVDRMTSDLGGETLAEKYAVAPLYLALFAAAVPARCVEFLVSTLAIARGRPEVNRNTHVATACIAIPILALLVWLFGPWGAAVMPLVYQAIFLSMQARQLRAEMPEIIRHTTRSASIGTALLGALLLGVTVPGAIWFFPLGALAYLLLGHLLGGWDLTLLVPERRAAEASA